VSRIVYFGDHDVGGHLIVLASYAVAGVVIAIIGSIIHERRTATGQPGRGWPRRTAVFTPARATTDLADAALTLAAPRSATMAAPADPNAGTTRSAQPKSRDRQQN
jgi:hypothetical protein